MTPERWSQIQESFHRLLEISSAERKARLEELRRRDLELARQVSAMLKADATIGRRDGAQNAIDKTLDRSLDDFDSVGRRLGPYRIIEKLGQGGMGTVYLAERADGEFRRQVAIKLVRPGLDDDQILRRVRQERQILAALQHPCIAQLLDGGATENGRPYVVMEYVRGEPIDVHCDRLRLTVAERLRLFRKVCDAVGHAHGQLILHRDLKPANLLVTEDGRPKLLDFGIAKILDVDSPFTLAETEPGSRMLTPAFASPEQARGEALTTASDVYSLGVLLFLLLTGRMPYSFGPRTVDFSRALDETEPPRPSSVVQTSPVDDFELSRNDPTPRQMADRRGVRPERLRRLLSGDLDTIVLTALRKEPERRYASVEQFSEDLRRHLESLPIRARPDSSSYRVKKFVERHRLGVIAVLMLIATLVAGMVATTQQARRADQNFHKAEAQRLRAEWVVDLLVKTVDLANPEQALGREVTVREVLDTLTAVLSSPSPFPSVSDSAPADRAKLLDTAGRAYLGLGRPQDAATALEKALYSRRSTSGEKDSEVAESLAHLARARYQQGRYREAEELLLESLALRRSIFGESHPRVAESLNDLAAVAEATGRLGEANELYERSLSIYRAVFGEQNEEYAQALSNRGIALFKQGKPAQAETHLRQALEIRQGLFDPSHPWVTGTAVDLASVLWTRGRAAEAEALMREQLELQLQVFEEDHPQVSRCRQNLAIILAGGGRFEEAQVLFQQTLESQRRRLGDSHPMVATTTRNLADLKVNLGALDEAEDLYRQALSARRKGDAAPQDLVVDIVRLANLLLARSSPEAEDLYRQALALKVEDPSQGIERSLLLLSLGQSLLKQARAAEAEAPLRQAFAELSESRGPEHPDTLRAQTQWRNCLAQLGRSDQGTGSTKVAKPPATSEPAKIN